MKCDSCQYRQRLDGSTTSICCKAIRQHPVFGHLDELEKKNLELETVVNGLPYTTKTNEPLVDIDPHAQGMGWANWPIDYEPQYIKDCKLYSLAKHAIGWVKI